MDKFTLVNILLLIPILGNDLFCQTVEVLGQLKVSTVNLNNAATDVLVRNADGSIAKRDVATIGGASQISDADNNTKVTTEKNANEDVIRFDLFGIEKFVFNKNSSNYSRLEFKNNNKNVLIGDSCGLVLNVNAIGNTGIGNKALLSHTGGDFNVAIGAESLYNINNNGTNGNTAIGYQALKNNPYANGETAIGYQSSYNSGSAAGNTSVGYQSLYQGGGNNSTAMGYRALYNAISFAEHNTAIGFEALFSNVENDGNTAIGANALRQCVYGSNTAIGNNALRSTTQASHNVAIGSDAMQFNMTGGDNVAIGSSSLSTNIQGGGNVAVGHNTLQLNKTSSNVAIGYFSLNQTQFGSANTAVGSVSLAAVTGSRNTGLGYSTLSNLINGSDNTALGADAGVLNDGLSNTTAVGANAKVSVSNAVVLGNNANVGIGITAPTSKLHVIGDGVFSGTLTASCGVLTCSDVRYKKNIVPITNALSSIILLNGVRYNLKAEEFQERQFTNKPQIGLLAQDVELIYPEVVFTDQKGYKAIDYSKLTPVLIEAIKELKEELKDLKEQVAKLKNNQHD